MKPKPTSVHRHVKTLPSEVLKGSKERSSVFVFEDEMPVPTHSSSVVPTRLSIKFSVVHVSVKLFPAVLSPTEVMTTLGTGNSVKLYKIQLQ